MSNLTPASLKLTQVLVDPRTMTCAGVLQVRQKGVIENPGYRAEHRLLQFVLSSVLRMSITPFQQASGARAQVMVLVFTVHFKHQDLHVKPKNVLKLSKTTTN